MESSQNSANDSSEGSLKTLKYGWSKMKKKPLVVFLFIISLLFVFQAYRYSKLSQQMPNYLQDLGSLSDNLVVLDIKFDRDPNPNSFSIKFNYPVEPHQLEHSVALSPKLPGSWSVDENDESLLRFDFERAFSGSELWVYISKDLSSELNNRMSGDFQKRFAFNTINYDEPFNRVQSYSSGKEIPIPKYFESVKIYRSNLANLLKFMIYNDEDTTARGSVYQGNYALDSIDHANFELVEDFKVRSEKKSVQLEPGIYYLENERTRPFFIVVSDFGVVLRQDDKRVVFGAFDYKQGTALKDSINVGLYNLKGAVNTLRSLTYSGENSSVTLSYPDRLDAVIAKRNGQIAFVPVELPTSLADINVNSDLDKDSQIFLYTDRPIYKPGDKIFVKGIVRMDSDSLYRVPPAGTTVYLSRYLQNDNSPVTITTLDDYGSFHAEFEIPKDVTSDYSYVQASLQPLNENNYRAEYTYFSIVSYNKPDFEIKTNVEKGEYLRSDKIKFTISGNYFDGKPLQNTDVDYLVYTDNYYESEKAVYNKNFNVTAFGGMCGPMGQGEDYFGSEYQKGTVRLDGKGMASIETEADEKTLSSQKITLVAKRVDQNKNEIVSAANTIVHAAEFNIFFLPSADKYKFGEEVVAPFYAESLNGEKIADKEFNFNYTEYQYITGTGRTEKKFVYAGTVKSDENGKGIVRFTLPERKQSGYQVLTISGIDSKNNTVQNQKSLSILSAEEAKEYRSNRFWGGDIDQTYLRISSSQNSFKVGDEITLNIKSPRDLDVLFSLERGRVYQPRLIHLSKGENKLQIPVTEDLSPSITAVFSFFAEGEYYSEGLALNVPAMHKLLRIGLSTDRKIYDPNDTAELKITTHDANGTPVATQLAVGVVDKAIFALRKSATMPIHSSFYFFRPRRTNASSSLTGMSDWAGGGGGGGGGGETFGSKADTLYWNPNLRTDSRGEIIVPIPLLGHETSWKVQVFGNTLSSDVGQNDTEFVVTSNVKGAKTKKRN